MGAGIIVEPFAGGMPGHSWSVGTPWPIHSFVAFGEARNAPVFTPSLN